MAVKQAGQIVLTPFPHTDLSGTKLRPVLMLRQASRFGVWPKYGSDLPGGSPKQIDGIADACARHCRFTRRMTGNTTA